MNSEIQETLDDIRELGWVSIRDGKIIDVVSPKESVMCINRKDDRWNVTIDYLRDYSAFNEDFGGDFFICTYDGWREYSFCATEEPKYIPWRNIHNKQLYIGKGNKNEPRFRHAYTAPKNIYPELSCRVITYNSHLNDRCTALIPDSEFLGNQFSGFVQQVVNYDVTWETKNPIAFWRGSRHTTTGYEYDYLGLPPKHPRVYFANLSLPNVETSFDHCQIKNQLKYKYLLDADGLVNAWSALYWKLSSSSLVIKHKSHWYQWYYPMLEPWKHYVPLDRYEDLPNILEWCKNNDSQCKQIAEDASQLVKKLTRKYAVEEYKIK